MYKVIFDTLTQERTCYFTSQNFTQGSTTKKCKTGRMAFRSVCFPETQGKSC